MAQSWIWSNSVSGSSSGNGVAVDGSGNIYVTGGFSDTMRLGTWTLVPQGRADIFLIKYDNLGNIIWARRAGGTSSSSDAASGIAVDATGFIYITGNFSRQATFSNISVTGRSSSRDIFIAKYNPGGTAIWVRTVTGDPALSWQISSYDIAVSSLGYVYVTGTILGDCTFGSTTVSVPTASSVFVARYHISGSFNWVRVGEAVSTPTNSFGFPRGIEVNNNEEIFVTGSFQGPLNFDGISLNSTGTHGHDMFLIKYNGAGDIQWARRGGAPNNSDNAASIEVDNGGNCYVVGGFYNTATFYGPGFPTNINVTSNGGSDAYLAKYDNGGTPIWVKSFGGSNSDGGRDISIDDQGNLFFTGVFLDNLLIDTFALSVTGTNDVFVVKYDNMGAVQWAAKGGESDGIGVNRTALYENKSLFITGSFTGNSILGSTSINSIGTSNMFLTLLYDTFFAPNLNKINGHVLSDVNKNCEQDSSDLLLANRIIRADPGPYYAITDSNGAFTLRVSSGSYTLRQLIPQHLAPVISELCPADSFYTIHFDSLAADTSGFNYYNETDSCPVMNISVGALSRRLCQENKTLISYCNRGIVTANDAKLLVGYPEFVTPLSANHPFTYSQDSVLVFNLGHLPGQKCGTVSITDQVDCGNATIIGLTQCVEARITTTNSCFPVDSNWNGAGLSVRGKCVFTWFRSFNNKK